MCVQTVGLIQNAIENAGISTVSISLLREVTSALRPPRALFSPFRLGFPLGEPGNTPLQQQMIHAALALLERNDTPVFESFEPTNL
ncbi:MAG: hypothetical protein ACKV2V_24175 [Blastocatellia bacterium]